MASRNSSKNRKKTKSKRSSAKTSVPEGTQFHEDQVQESVSQSSSRRSPGYIPEDVSRRMVKRVVLFCGIPSFLGLGSFVLNYFLITGHAVDLPPYFTLIETLVFFGLGFVGISYGVLSASWEPQPGSVLGLSEFRTNLGNMVQQWREYAQKRNLSPPDHDTTDEES